MGLSISRSAARYSSILVHAGDLAEDEGMTRDAVLMANAFGARLVGVSTPAAGPADLDPAEQKAVEILIEAAGDCFRAATSEVHAGVVWRRVAATPVRALSSLAWSADLLMIGLRGRSKVDVEPDAIRTLLKKSQRAVLVRTSPKRRMGFRRALILWDQSPACCRSILSALPLLAKVDYLVIRPIRQSQRATAVQALCDLEQGLRVRGLPVQVVHERACDPNETTHDYVRGFDPDLLVMSGRTRWGRRSITETLRRYETYVMLSL